MPDPSDKTPNDGGGASNAPNPPAAQPKPTPLTAKPGAAPPGKTKGVAKAAETSPDANDPIALLKADHRKVEALFNSFEKAPEQQKAELVRQICAELVIHTLIEEEIFYPACRRAAGQDAEAEEGLNEAQVEHDGAKQLIADLWGGGEGDELREAKVTVLAEMIRHHVGEEEKPGEGIFAKAEEKGVDNPDVARRLRQRKQALQADQERGRLQPGAPVSFNPQPRPTGRFAQENDMPRNYGPERDERGRFTSEDDDRGGRSYGARTQGGRYTRDDDDDRRGRGQGGWFGDPEGHSRASREGWDDRRGGEGRSFGRGRDEDDDRGRSYGRGRDDDDDRRGGRGQGGWFGDSEGHSRASREGWDDRRGGEGRSYGRGRDDDDDRGRSYGRGRDDDDRRGGRGQGGWFGDSEGHSRASREGWDNPDHGPSGWYGDSRGHSEASRRGWDNPDHGRSGWYGDPEGHSEASRRGWDERRDDDRSYRSRGRDDDDDRRGGGQGGWFGDSRGHSEASRRGWQDRR